MVVMTIVLTYMNELYFARFIYLELIGVQTGAYLGDLVQRMG